MQLLHHSSGEYQQGCTQGLSGKQGVAATMDAPQHWPASYLQGCDPGHAEEKSLQGTTVMHLHPACSSAHDSCWAVLSLLKDRHAHGTRDAATPCLLISTWPSCSPGTQRSRLHCASSSWREQPQRRTPAHPAEAHDACMSAVVKAASCAAFSASLKQRQLWSSICHCTGEHQLHVPLRD